MPEAPVMLASPAEPATVPAAGPGLPQAPADGRPSRSQPSAAQAAQAQPAQERAAQAQPAQEWPAQAQPAQEWPAQARLAPARPARAQHPLAGALAARGRQLRLHLRDPLFRNAYALMINTATTGLLGLVYWLLAARAYPAADVGRASAAYAGMNLLAGITGLSLTGALARFIPQSGRTTRALVVRAYVVSALASAVLTVPFLVVAGHWGSSYSELTGVVAGFAFTMAVVSWAIFTLQDGVLVGLRGAPWVAAENGVFGVAKIVLLIGLAVALPHLGIYVSWMLPVVLSLPLVNMLIFRRLVPRHEQQNGHRPPPTSRQVGRFVAGDFTGAICLLATASLVPVIVATLVTPDANAYFYMAWTIGTAVDLLAINMAMSLTVESALHAGRLAGNTRAALRKTMLILTPVAALTALLAPWALSLFGPGYAAHGAVILQLLAAAALPKALTEIYLGALRAQSHTSRVAVIQAIRGVLVLGLAVTLTTMMGTVGAGVAVLASQVATMILILPGLRGMLATARRPRAAVEGGATA